MTGIYNCFLRSPNRVQCCKVLITIKALLTTRPRRGLKKNKLTKLTKKSKYCIKKKVRLIPD